MRVGSLFSGIGGVELGFKAEGFTTEWTELNALETQLFLSARKSLRKQSKNMKNKSEAHDRPNRQ